MTLKIIQDFDYQSDGSWLWSVWIDGKPEELDKVESVRYTLDSSYDESVRTSSERKSKFLLIEKALIGFTIYAKITYRDGHEEHLQHDLTFAKISVKSERQQKQDETWDWWLWIEGDAVELNKIKNVSYQLPDSKKKTTRDRKSDFSIRGNNSGIIKVFVEVVFSDGRYFPFEEILQLTVGRQTTENRNIANNVSDLFPQPDLSTITETGVPQVTIKSTHPTKGSISTKANKTDETIANIISQDQEASPTITVVDRINLNVQPMLSELLKFIKRPSNPIASSEVDFDIQSVLDNPKFPANIEQLKQYIRSLKDTQDFALACKLLNVVLQIQDQRWLEHRVWIKQQLAICTYKDEKIPSQKRLDKAVAILEEIDLRKLDNNNSETLARGGAIYKRKWQASGQLEYLNESLSFYLAAYERNPEQDMGYGGVNAAFIMDLLAHRNKLIAYRSGAKAGEFERLQQKAADLRRRMATEIPVLAAKRNSISPTKDYLDNQFWFQLTMAEIHFGLKNYEEAGEWLCKAKEINAWEWEKATIFNKLLHIARLQGVICPGEYEQSSDWHPAWKALSYILGEDTGRALANGRGKVGLALSGEGFRASLFHLGVMARLAEMDALRGVEVLSTVSGGSILGAYYYLELQKLLQTKPDKEITREDYIELVKRIQGQFVSGVQKNIRMRAYSNIRDNMRMLYQKNGYTRSHRLGELYESILYEQVRNGHDEGVIHTMPQLLIQPAGEPNQQPYNPKASNWRRQAKVPALLLNCTSLNSGHNWQFTAKYMGEPLGLIDEDIDARENYRTIDYKAAPTDKLKEYPLGYAVAASACIQGLFEPLSIEGLFEGRTVRLVDGGIQDALGINSLLNEECTLILCSDASGKMVDVAKPSDDPGIVLRRTTSILQDRVRQSGYADLLSRLDSCALQGLFFVHTKKELESTSLDCIAFKTSQTITPPTDYLTSYGVARDLQEKIASIRTDLDAFSEVEAYALMASGYLITKAEFKLLQHQHEKAGNAGTWGSYYIDAKCGEWPFSPLEPILASKPAQDLMRIDLEKQLKNAAKTFFMAYNLMPIFKGIVYFFVVVIFLDINDMLTKLWSEFGHNLLSIVGLFILFVIVIIILLQMAYKWMFPQEEEPNRVIKFSISILGYILSKAYLGVFDRFFLARGKLKRLLDL